MISIDDHPPSDPSSSHHNQQQISHDKASVSVSDLDLKFPDADLDDTNNPIPNFSIRDHVFSLRSKDVACNWPFSPTSLQLCLRYGVKNLLPPFQPLDLLRDNYKSSFTRCNLEKTHLPNEEILTTTNLDGKPMDNRDKFKLKSNEEIIIVRSLNTNTSGSKENHKETHTRSKEKPPASSQPISKKSKFVMKPNPGVEVDQENVPNSFIVSETMASKVCPVCKTFSSSSNTTLNAHIDQCLTGETSMKWTENPKVIVKHRVKPRKTRLMVDIYETAPHCTVKELDRRNGTSWATNSSFAAQEIQFQEKEEKEKKEPAIIASVTPEVADNEGDVYIDTNGTKVRILSVPKTGSLDNIGGRKLLKGVKGGKIVIGKKKSNLYKQKHNQKCLKLGSNSKKSCLPKLSRVDSEIVEEQIIKSGQVKDVSMEENCSKGGREPMKSTGLAIVRPPWACSKRTDLVKKFSGKHRKLELLQFHVRKDSVVEGEDKSCSRIQKKMKVLSPLTKPSSKLLRKDDTFIHNEEDEEEDSHSDDPDIRKFSPLRKNLSFSASKTHRKRKFADFKKSVETPSQSLSKERSRIRIEEASRKKKDQIRICEEEEEDKSSTSKSSYGGSESMEDDDDDVQESSRNETLPDVDQDCVNVPATTMINDADEETSLMGLTNSFDLVKPDNKFDKLYDQICSTNCVPDGKNIFGNDIEEDNTEKHENYFQEVELDPIPIPGPPGSFLPASPGGDMVSEEIQPIRVPPTENHYHHDHITDRDSMSNSPVSTVSNPSMARSDSRSSEKLSYNNNNNNNRSASVIQDDQRPGFFSIMVDPNNFKKSFSNNGDWKPLDHTEKIPSPSITFKNDHQPCCCSRKETALNYQDLSFLRKQQPNDHQSNGNPNFRSDMFLNYPTSQPHVKLPIYSDSDSAASPSKPVLRLMGKNLTVVKTDEDVSSSSSPHQFRPPMVRTDPKEDHGSFSPRPVVFSQYPNGSDSANHFNDQPPVNVRSFMGSSDRYGHGGPQLGPMARSNYGYNNNGLDHSQVATRRNPFNGATTGSKEIIVIDNECDGDQSNEFLRRNQFYTMYQSLNSADPYSGGGGGSGGFHGGNGDLGKWNCTPAAGYYP